MSLPILSKEDVIKRFASLEFNRFLDYYKNAPDLNAPADDFREMAKEENAASVHSRVVNQNIPVCLST
jgi:hypothetical protein